MAIRFSCDSCGKGLKAPDGASGKKTKCPDCGASLIVPEADEVFDAEPIVDESEDEGYGIGIEEVHEEEPSASGSDKPRRPCPMCGEFILERAAKCRYCGEIFDPKLKKKQRRTSPDDEDMTTGDWVVAILCAGIGCIAGVVWMIQGKPKGLKMTGVSIAAIIFWNIVNFIVTQANLQR